MGLLAFGVVILKLILLIIWFIIQALILALHQVMVIPIIYNWGYQSFYGGESKQIGDDNILILLVITIS